MLSSSPVRITRRGPVARVALHRPEARNALNEEMIALLRGSFEALRDEAEIRVVVLEGSGPSFSAGADIDWMRRAARLDENQNRLDAAALAAMLRSLAECPKPVVARVHGYALGGGAGLVAAADLAVAAKSAVFGFTEVRLGLIPATVAPYVIGKVGAGAALRLFLLGERFGAVEALQMGFLHRVVEDSELDSAIDNVTASLLAGGPRAQRADKELIRGMPKAAGADLDAYTSAFLARVRAGKEAREGVQAFLEKRKPTWSGEDQASLGSEA